MIHWEKHIINASFTLREAMMRIDSIGAVNSDLFVVNDHHQLQGSLSDGDIRRSLIKGAEMSDSVVSAMHSPCVYGVGTQPSREVIDHCKLKGIRFLPLVSESKQIFQIIDVDQIMGILPVEAIIMAGGEGKRLRPLTEHLPKPLLPVDGKPIIEYNIDRLIKFGVNNIRISINYLGHLLQNHFGDGSSKNIEISYISEDAPMGTIGAVRTVNNWKTEHVLVMNSDVLTDIDFADFYNEFVESGASLAIAATSYSVNIPYAVLETGKGNQVYTLAEKPTYTYYSNAGIYLMNLDVLDFIPYGKPYDMPDLINALMEKGHKVISYPIRGYWLDIGKMNDYEKAQTDIKHLKL
jgi:dTDP-glucose pyrophosphorylase